MWLGSMVSLLGVFQIPFCEPYGQNKFHLHWFGSGDAFPQGGIVKEGSSFTVPSYSLWSYSGASSITQRGTPLGKVVSHWNGSRTTPRTKFLPGNRLLRNRIQIESLFVLEHVCQIFCLLFRYRRHKKG